MVEELMSKNIALNRFLIFVACMTFILIIAGALVTSNDAGLSAPDWPLSFGQWMPEMVGGLFWEHGHRMIATSVGLLTTIAVVWILLREPRRWVRRVGLLALAGVGAQGILGGMTVLFLLPFVISVSHACLAQIFFCTITALAVFTSRHWQEKQGLLAAQDYPPLRRHALVTTGMILVQLLLGAAFRHKGLGIIPHMVGALLVTLMVGWMVIAILRRYGSESYLTRPAMLLSILVLVQLFLGIAAFIARIVSANDPQPLNPMIALTVAHVAGGALTLVLQWILTLRMHSILVSPGVNMEIKQPLEVSSAV
jgi:cytochrome c oxidase assembly protein subunit 15